MQRKRGSEGFTLLEILIVVTIIGVLMAVLGNNFLGRVEGSKMQLASVQVDKLSGTIDLYRIDNGSYPTTDQGLDALVSPPTSGPQPRRYQPGGYAKVKDLLDPWGGPLTYQAPGQVNTSSFDLCSLGPDGQPGGDGPNADICNYSSDQRRS
jgi:general secretion pathway protein G